MVRGLNQVWCLGSGKESRVSKLSLGRLGAALLLVLPLACLAAAKPEEKILNIYNWSD